MGYYLKNTLLFEVDSAEIIDEENPSSQFATARINAFSTGRTLHDTTCDLETLKKTASTIYEKPIVFEYKEHWGDFGTHTRTPIIAGFVVPETASFFKRDDGTGRVTLSVIAKVWKKYAPKFMSVFSSSTDKKRKVSVEMEVLDSEELSNGLLLLKDWIYSAVCVLGEFVTEASPGANIELLSFAKQENMHYKEAFQMEFGKYDSIDFLIPEKIKTTVSKALEGASGSSVSLSMGRFLSKSEKITPERIRQIVRFFKNKNIDEVDSKIISLYGGKEGVLWAREIYEKVKEIDDKKLSYFSNEEESSNEETHNRKEEENLKMAEQINKDEEKKEDFANAEGEEKEPLEEEKKETPADENKEGEEKKMSYASMFSQEQMAKMFAEEEDDDEETKAKFAAGREEFSSGKNPEAMCHALFAALQRAEKKMAKTDAQMSVYLSENQSLKEKFAKIEEKEKEFAVSTFLNELADKLVVSEEDLATMRNKSIEFSLGELETWKNHCKAFSFEFARKDGEKGKERFVKFSLPFEAFDKVSAPTSVWDEIK